MPLTGCHSEGIQLTGTHCLRVHTWTCSVQGKGNKTYNWQDTPLKLPCPDQAGFADGWLSQRHLHVRGENLKLLFFPFFNIQVLSHLYGFF